jgi:hypothetical protein
MKSIAPDSRGVVDGLDEDQLIERATMTCDCEGAVKYRAEVQRKQKALKNVSALFGDDAPKEKRFPAVIVQLLKEAAELLCDSRMEKMTVNLWGGKGDLVTK